MLLLIVELKSINSNHSLSEINRTEVQNGIKFVFVVFEGSKVKIQEKRESYAKVKGRRLDWIIEKLERTKLDLYIVSHGRKEGGMPSSFS